MTALTPQRGIRAKLGAKNTAPMEVQFNPATLVYEFTNTLKEEGKGESRAQYTTQTSAKLTIDLVFDTTDKGNSVTDDTRKILELATPKTVKKEKETREVPPLVVLTWGAFEFSGVIESFKETIDYFSHEGVPLRSTLNLKLSEKTSKFGAKSTTINRGSLASDGLDMEDPSDVVEPPAGENDSVQDQANKTGEPGLARELGAANGIENLRAPLTRSVLVDGGRVPLGPPAAFAAGPGSASGGFGSDGSASAGFGASAGAGFGADASAGFGASASAGFRAGASAGFSAGAAADFSVGASASLGGSGSVEISTEARFSGLRAVSPLSSVSFDTSKLLPGAGSAPFSVERSSSFSFGGKALTEGSASLSADVGAGVTWAGGGFVSASGKIRFEE